MFNGKRIDELEGQVRYLQNRVSDMNKEISVLKVKLSPSKLFIYALDDEGYPPCQREATDDEIKAAYQEIMAREQKAKADSVLSDMRLAGAV